MKLIFEVYLAFSLMILSQQSVMAKVQFNLQTETVETEEHEHKHSLLVAVETILLGSVEHEHEHDDNEDPWTTHTHDSRTHSHVESQNMKIEMTSAKSFAPFSDSNKLIVSVRQLDEYLSDYTSEIFRPPIKF